MGLISDVITRYKADVSDHVKELKKLKGEERERAKQIIEDNEKIEKSLDDQLKTLGKAAVGLAAFYAAGKAAVEGYRFALEQSRLEQGASGVSIEGLRRASAGLKSDMDLLRDAVKFKSAAFKMSQQDMEDVEAAQRQLIRTGKDEQKVHEAINQALTKLSTEGLQELGINVQKAGLSMDDASDRAELFKRVMAALHVESTKVADAELTKEERLAASGVAFENAVDAIKKAVGEMVVALAPLIQKVAELVANIAKIPGAVRTGAQHSAGTAKKMANITAGLLGYDDIYIDEDEWNNEDHWNKMGADLRRYQRAQQLFAQGQTVAANALLNGGTEDGSNQEALRALAQMVGGLGLDSAPGVGAPGGAGYKGKGERDKAASEAAALMKKYIDIQQGMAWDALKRNVVEWLNAAGDARREQGIGLSLPGAANADIFSADITKLLQAEPGNRSRQAYEAFRAERRQSFLESAFGPLDDFNKYAAGFQLLTGAVQASMDAWITGSESMGTAVKRAIGAGLKALAAELAMQALRHGAYALGSLAFGDVRGASMHGLAAAKFAAGAAATAVVAREFGHGGTDYGRGGGGAGASVAPGPRPANSNQSPGREIVYVVGDPFDTETNPRRRQQNAKRLLRQTGYSPTPGGDY